MRLSTEQPPMSVKAAANALPLPGGLSSWRTGLDFLELTKPRLLTLVLVATAAGFCLGAVGPIDVPALLHTVLATALVAGAANALNQVLERDTDAHMKRTAVRPLPTGRLQPTEALAFGVACGVTGVSYLSLAVNLLAGFVAAFTLAVYVFAYTPLKRRTALATLVGAVPGALPPLIGWTAARGSLTAEAGAVFLILFLWQLPHFLAIAWMYRHEYARAGLPLLTGLDDSGGLAGRQCVLYSAAFLPASLLPGALGLAGSVYFVTAFVLSALYIAFSVRMAMNTSERAARALFRFSVLQLAVLLAVMTFDKVAI